MKELANYIREINDFPKEGIQFKDIATLLQDPKGVELCLENLMKLIDNEKIDKVVGIESRGFFFGTLLAQKLNAGFVPVRKPGKLPYKTISETYDLEYGTDVVEIHIDAIKKGERVLIHDDVIATGGTAAATHRLVEFTGAQVAGYSFIIDLSFLNGRTKLDPNLPFSTLVRY